MREHAVEAVRGRRAGGAAGGVVGSEHEVVDDELRAAVEQLRQRACAVLGVEAFLLLQRHPGELAPLPREFVAEPRVLLPPSEERLARGEPLFPCSDLLIRHRLSFPSSEDSGDSEPPIACASGTSTAARGGKSFWASTTPPTTAIKSRRQPG